MPVTIDSALPAAEILRREGLQAFPAGAACPDKRVAMVNLMPLKPDTELDFMRLIAPCLHNVGIELINMKSHKSRNTPAEHIRRFYHTPDETDFTRTDGVIITGAPLEFVRFEEVTYWKEVTQLMDCLRDSGTPVMNICWAAFASLYHTYGIEMRLLDRKISGVYPHRITRRDSPLMRGVADGFTIPHSRFATWLRSDISSCHDLRIVAESDEAGIYMLESKRYREHYIVGHGEYGRLTLDGEYRRDMAKGISPHVPEHYYPADNPAAEPPCTWHDTAVTIMANWIDTL